MTVAIETPAPGTSRAESGVHLRRIYTCKQTQIMAREKKALIWLKVSKECLIDSYLVHKTLEGKKGFCRFVHFYDFV